MRKLLAVLLALLLAFTLAACGGKTPPVADSGESEIIIPSSDSEMPFDLVSFIDEEMDAIQGIRATLCGEWADKHFELMNIDYGMEEYDKGLYDQLKSVLDEHRVGAGAYHVYAMVPNTDNDYLITVDGSANPHAFMTNYGWEIQFDEAWSGDVDPASAKSGWDDEKGVPYWSCFAPVYNSNNEVVCIIGIDMPCEILNDYPEWNRDRTEWNRL